MKRLLVVSLAIGGLVGASGANADTDSDCSYRGSEQHCTFSGSEQFFDFTFTYTEELRVEVVYPDGQPCWILTTRPIPDPEGLIGLGAGFTPDQLAELEDFVRTSYTHCPAEYDTEAELWEVFAQLELDIPEPALAPKAAGITGLATHLTDDTDTYLYWSGTLPNGVFAEVEATLDEVIVDWGDGTLEFYPPGALATFDAISHTYRTKTCPPDYRETHPRGHLCHPTLEAYPITVTYLWSGQYNIGAGWVGIGTRDLSTTVDYDVDETIGVLQP